MMDSQYFYTQFSFDLFGSNQTSRSVVEFCKVTVNKPVVLKTITLFLHNV